MLKLSFINVGYGESILLEAGGTVILIDGGSGEDEEYLSDSGRIRTKDYLAKKGIDILDLAIVTHAHEDHVSGLEQYAAAGGTIKKLLTVRKLPSKREELYADTSAKSGTRKFLAGLNRYSRLLTMLEERGTELVEADGETGTLHLAADLDAEIIAPSFERAEELSVRVAELYKKKQGPDFAALTESLAVDLNAYSMVLMLHFGEMKFFLPGDATPDKLYSDSSFKRALAAGRLKAYAVKLAHHGQADSVNEAFINAAAPSLVVTCASGDRRYQSAHPSVYAKIADCMAGKGIKPVFLFSDYIQGNHYDYAAGPRRALEIVLDGKAMSHCYIPPETPD